MALTCIWLHVCILCRECIDCFDIHVIECIRNIYDLFQHIWHSMVELWVSAFQNFLQIENWLNIKKVMGRNVCTCFVSTVLTYIAMNALEIPKTCVNSIDIQSIECIMCFDPLFWQCQHIQHTMHFMLWSFVSTVSAWEWSHCTLYAHTDKVTMSSFFII